MGTTTAQPPLNPDPRPAPAVPARARRAAQGAAQRTVFSAHFGYAYVFSRQCLLLVSCSGLR